MIMSTNKRLTKRQITAMLATVALIATVVTLSVSYYARTQAHAQALQACTQASEALKHAKADAQSALSKLEADEATAEAANLEGSLGQDLECDPQASTKTLKAQAVKITQQTDTIQAAAKTLNQAQMSAAKETLTQATGSLKSALEQAEEVLTISEGKINDNNARTKLSKLVDQAKQAISTGSPSELKSIREAASNLKQLLTDLTGQTAAVSSDHDNYLKTQAEAAQAQADAPTSSYEPTYGGSQWAESSQSSEYTPPQHQAPAPNTGSGGNSSGSDNGGWVVTEEEECWQFLTDPKTDTTIRVPCTP